MMFKPLVKPICDTTPGAETPKAGLWAEHSGGTEIR